MSLVIDEVDADIATPTARQVGARFDFPARVDEVSWPATRRGREEVLQDLTSAPFIRSNPVRQRARVMGLKLILDWLGEQPGVTWQDRWLASGAEAAGTSWRQVPAA
jgi:hypothetical protein